MYEVEKSDSGGDETVETTFEVRQGQDMSTVFEMRDSNDRREQLVKRLEVYTDSAWASDQMTRKSKGGAVIMAEGMRLHAHSRGQASVALSSCEAEVMAASEGIKEALLLQEVLMFAGLGHYEIEIKVDSSAAHAFFHRRGVGRMKHIDSRIFWLQNLIAAGGVRHVDAYTKSEGTGGISTVDESQELQ